MLPHGQRRRQCVVLLALCFAGVPSTSTVLVYTQNASGSGQGPTRFDDVPAMEGFGPLISAEGFAGRLQLAKPNVYACSSIDGPAEAPGVVESEAAGPPDGARRDRGKLTGQTNVSNPSEMLKEGLQQAVAPGAGTSASAAGTLPVAVLISRSVHGDPDACTFEAKVINAQRAGFAMVIVFDSEQERMFKMGRPDEKGAKRKTVEIPLVLVTHASGLALTALIAASSDPRGPEIYVDDADPLVGAFVTVNLTMFILVSGFLLALLTCGSMMVVTLHRYLRRYEELVAGTNNRPMSLPEVLQLLEVRVEQGSKLEGEACPVCLEAYRPGDRLRSLPCQHAFHAGCITPWLTERQRSCPMCKDPVVLGTSPSSSTPAIVIETPGISQASPRSTLLVSNASPPALGEGGGAGDRLPLLSNLRGAANGGGSINHDTSPV